MYDRFSACLHLKVLDLGIMARYVFGSEGDEGDMDAAVETMELTLEFGLYRLARLTRLEEFGCSMPNKDQI
ncbi:hypothetical protein BGX23_002554 [Mortierella sp. AD031]|nr:hypothetical protein BGX23_002554 [Mortierella sp. AD031]